MDISRPDLKRKKNRRRYLIAGAGILVVAGISIGVAMFEVPVPEIAANEVAIATAQRGDMARESEIEGVWAESPGARSVVKIHARVIGGSPAPATSGQATLRIDGRALPVKLEPVLDGRGVSTGEIELVADLSQVGPNRTGTFSGVLVQEPLHDVVYIPRPGFGNAGNASELFKVDASGRFANRTEVHFGEPGPGCIVVIEGIAPGDRVILSDMSHQPNRIRINWPARAN